MELSTNLKNELSNDVESHRAVQEVQASLIIAKKFPRDENQSFKKIINACKRNGLASTAIYSFPRGGQKVEGPSIRLAEVLAQCWGNIEYGIKELSSENGISNVMAFAWDKESNTRSIKEFSVKHERYTKKGTSKLTDPRDVYEHIASQGQRRVRACILAIIPPDIVEEAEIQCNKTMTGKSDVPISDRIRAMVTNFSKFGVSTEMMEARLGHNIDVTSETELVSLKKIYMSIKDGMAGREQYFEFPKTAPKTNLLDGLKELKKDE